MWAIDDRGGTLVSVSGTTTIAGLRRLVALAIVLILGVAAQARADTITDLGDITPLGVNGNDQVVGDVTDNSGDLHAALWNGSLQMLRQLSSTDQSDAYAISAGGRIAGDDFGGTSSLHGVYWNGGGTANQFGPFNGVDNSTDDTVLNGVDTAGDLVGFTPESSTNLSLTGFLYHAGTVVQVGQTDLGAQPGGTTVGAITADGTRMLGYTSTSTTTYYLWSSATPSGPGTALDITPPTSDARGLDGIVGGTLISNDLASDGTVLGYKGSSRNTESRTTSGCRAGRGSSEGPVPHQRGQQPARRRRQHPRYQHVGPAPRSDLDERRRHQPEHAVAPGLRLGPDRCAGDQRQRQHGVGIGAHNGHADGFLLNTSASVSVRFGSIAKTQVGKTVDVPVTVTAGPADLSTVGLGHGLAVSGDHAKVEAEPDGITGFSLSAGQSKTFTFKLKGVSEGDAGLSVSVTARSARGNVTDSADTTVHVWHPVLDVVRVKVPTEREPADTIDIQYRGLGWDPAGGEIGLRFSNEDAGHKAQAATFDGTLKIRRWPKRTTDENAIKDHAGGGYCWGELSAGQGALSDGGKVEGKWSGWVLWSANPEIKAHQAWCEGEQDTFLAKSPEPIVVMGDFPEGRKFGLAVKVFGSNGAGTASPTLIISGVGPLLNYHDGPRDVCVAVSLHRGGDLITTVTHGKCVCRSRPLGEQLLERLHLGAVPCSGESRRRRSRSAGAPSAASRRRSLDGMYGGAAAR